MIFAVYVSVWTDRSNIHDRLMPVLLDLLTANMSSKGFGLQMFLFKGPECAQLQLMPKDTYRMSLCTINIRDKTSQNAVPNNSAEENNLFRRVSNSLLCEIKVALCLSYWCFY